MTTGIFSHQNAGPLLPHSFRHPLGQAQISKVRLSIPSGCTSIQGYSYRGHQREL